MKFEIPSDETRPHKAVLWVCAEVHEVTPQGECSGRQVYKIDRFPLAIDGADKAITIRKLNEVLEALKKSCTR